ncbi:hypothetical protein ARHIZOSPH14_10050 [Agromyces rhizosphaerae]|uniref:Uncharacterized protein n=1 Tax=Agromyces rhizosphaerae TaxID=88374 RepID=A0A9W6FR53_9MICO|nr:hypothetical protein ARHIZOSPH14_10050 [Agromyces rhizosphaerae]
MQGSLGVDAAYAGTDAATATAGTDHAAALTTLRRSMPRPLCGMGSSVAKVMLLDRGGGVRLTAEPPVPKRTGSPTQACGESERKHISG